jgi:hypothetical protein
MTVTITHMYDDYDTAEDVVEDLETAGFARDLISIAGRGPDGRLEDAGDGAAAGATIGGVAGAGAGLMAAMGIVAIPGIGPLVAAGVLATTLAGAATGAVAGGLIGALVEYGISEEDAPVYAESLRRGGTLVSVQAHEDKAQEAEDVMQRHHPVDMQQRGQFYREAGWKGYDPAAPAYSGRQKSEERDRYRGTLG